MARRDVEVSLGVDGSDVKKGTDKAAKEVEDFGKRAEKSIKKYATNMAKHMLGFFTLRSIKGVMDDFDRIGKLATRLGSSAEDIQRLSRVAQLGGTDVETLARGLTQLNLELAKPENKKAADALERLGLSVRELKTKSAYEQFVALQQALQNAQKSGKGFAEVTALMGRAAAELIPPLQMSAAEMAKIEAMKLVDNEKIKNIEKLNDAWTNLTITVQAFAGQAIGSVGGLSEGYLKLRDQLAQGIPLAEAFMEAFSSYDAELAEATEKSEKDENRKNVEKAEALALAQEEAAKKKELIELVNEELALAAAKANFDEAEIARLERQAAIRKKTNELIEKGMDPDLAAAAAKNLRDLEEKQKLGPPAQERRRGARQTRGFGGLDEFNALQQAKELGIGVGQRMTTFRQGQPVGSRVGGRQMSEAETRFRLGMARLAVAQTDPVKESAALQKQNVEMLDRIEKQLQRLTVE